MLLARASCLLAVCGACGFEHGLVPGSDDASVADPDAAVAMDVANDAPVDGDPVMPPDASNCFGSFVSVCLTALPTTDLTVTTNTKLDTDSQCTQVQPQAGGPELCVVAARSITIAAQLQASGVRPLVLLATNSLTISDAGVLDVGSYKLGVQGQIVDSVVGAGAASGPVLCGNPTNGGNDNGGTAGAGGGAGGSFGGEGGDGADGANGFGGDGGTHAAATGMPTFLRGGCRGSSGGSGNGNAGGEGGAGGGAVLAIAGTSITNAGHIRAGGMGGYRGAVASGGGGGGSGGMIVLDAPTITNSGILNANGGGGGEGGGGVDPGEGGASAYTGVAAASGGGYGAYANQNGGNGGSGSWSTTTSGSPGLTDRNGGGAGGGGAGIVHVVPLQALGGIVSPPAS